MLRTKAILASAAFAALSCAAAFAQAKPAPDVVVFTNGDQMTGKFERFVGGSIVFKSDITGEQTIGLDKIKELHSATPFVAIKKKTHKQVETTHGAVSVEGKNIVLTPESGAPETIPAADLAFLIDEPTYQKEMSQHIGFFSGWNGTVTGGAAIVRSTTTSTTFTAGVGLIRAIPSVPYLPARNRTTFNLSETYGKQDAPTIPPTTPATPDAITKTNIFHADAERDQYLTAKRLYVLGTASFDHNYSLGLQSQQIYGGGLGWTPIKTPKQTLDLKGDVHYEMQTFFAAPGVAMQADVHLFGSTFTESYTRNLPKGMVFTESGDFLPGWTEMHAYSANGTATLTLPVWKRLAANVSTTDNYINNPSPYYKHNSYQFTTGLSYTLH